MDRPGTFETSVLGVATALGRCHASHSKEGSRRGPCQPLLCHAALELARLALVICSKADTRSYDESDTMNMRIFVTFSQSLLFQPRSNCSSVRSDRSAGTLNGGASSAPVSQELPISNIGKPQQQQQQQQQQQYEEQQHCWRE
ncbi:MAG: hypothetical protein WDW38_009940 [Sanguina aurantia]